MIQKNEKLFLAISKIYFADLSENEITSITENSDQTVTVNFASGKSWTEIYISRGTGTFSEKQKQVDEGDLFEQNIEFNFPGDGLDTQNQIKNLLRKPLILKLYFANCSTPHSKIIGTLDNPVFILQQLSSKDYQTKRDIQFVRISPYIAPFHS